MMPKLILRLTFMAFVLISIACYSNCLAGSNSPADIERTMELINKDKELMGRMGKEMKVFIKEIIVTGVVSFTPDQIRKITAPYENRWLTIQDIGQVKKSIRKLYREKNFAARLKKVRSKTKLNTLEIQVTENITTGFIDK